MLLWEHLGVPDQRASDHGTASAIAQQTQRLPFDLRCAAITKSGRRCRGRVLPHKECCVFHDPEAAAKRRAGAARSRKRTRLARLPDGYLRKITNRRSVGQAMDRLYREIRLGIITPEMGRVLFEVLNRLLDSGLADLDTTPRAPGRSRAARIRPKVAELLSRAERRAWNNAIKHAPESLFEDAAPRTPRRAAVAAESSAARSPRSERALTIPGQAVS